MRITLDGTQDQSKQILALHQKAVVAMQQNNLSEAERIYTHILKIDENHLDALHNLALIYYYKKNYKQAELLAVKAFNLAIPIHKPVIKNTLSMIYTECEQYVKAEKMLNELLVDQPDNMQAIFNLGIVLRKLGRFSESLKCSKRFLKQNKNHINCLNVIGGTYAEMGNVKKAIQYFKDVLKISPDNSLALKNLGTALMSDGKFEEGAGYLKKSLKNDPTNGEVYLTLARSNVYKKESAKPFKQQLLDAIETAEKGNNFHLLSFLYFAYAEMLSKDKHYSEAFKYLSKGNNVIYPKKKMDLEVYENRLSSVKKTFTPTFIQKAEKVGCSSDVPIFILGMPRSGTTLTDQILNGHSRVGGAGETKYIFDAFDHVSPLSRKLDIQELANIEDNKFKEAGEIYVNGISSQVKGLEFVTDKLPNNYKYVGFIHMMLPHAKIIHCRRHPLDVVLSCYMQRFADITGNIWTFNLEHAAYEYKFYHQQMKDWEQIFPNKMHHSIYEKLVDSTETEAKKMLSFCGLEWESACLNFTESKTAVRTASAYQVRQGIYKTAKFKWKRYEAELAPAIEILKDEVAEYEALLAE